ncbi:MAG TPA: hypothetical protein VIK94_01030 [Bacilli bacterium]
MKKRWVLSDKERFEMIKGIQKRIKECQAKGQNVSNLHPDYADWLIEKYEKALKEIKWLREGLLLIAERYYEYDSTEQMAGVAEFYLKGGDNE